MNNDLILHHYDASPYCEKLRLILGHKGLTWKSVLQPPMMPKPDLTPLTGGYRRLPMLQIGADMYIDSALIARELERRFPEPTLYPSTTTPFADAIVGWADVYLFWKVVRMSMGVGADRIPEPFARDRALMNMPEMLAPQAAKAELPQTRSQLQIALGWLENSLAKLPFLAGTKPAYADYALYHCVWFLNRVAPDMIEASPDLNRWMQAVAAVGHGTREEFTAAEAFDVARAAAPQALSYTSNANDISDVSGIIVGDKVSITAEYNGTESVVGEVVGINPERISITREAPEIGRVVVHFPRFSYVIKKL
jgi:glutathione S-transferase